MFPCCQALTVRTWQAVLYEVLVSGPLLSEDEREVLRWGHNARVGQNAPKRLNQGKQLDTYKKATALECLVRSSASWPFPVHASPEHCRHACAVVPLDD